jgi:hypothetical protein
MGAASTRRTFLVGSSAGLVLTGASASALFGLRVGSGPSAAVPAAASSEPIPGVLPEFWPTQAPDLAREMVGASHGRVEKVRELLAVHPSLARAAWDWGFGDWETALGAASHVGNREIAELLLAHGASPTLHSAAMLGQLATVRAFVEASPGVQQTPGPHGLTLLHHARAGGEPARPVVDYLERTGGADPQPALVALSDAEQAALVGTYIFGPGASERIVVAHARQGLTFERAGRSALRLFHLGGLVFHPPAVPGVRIRFEREAERILAVTVHDPSLVLRATRAAAAVG